MNKDPVIKNNRIKELDALRGIAALSVVLFHLTLGRPQAKFGFKLGWTGVDLFFIISGFVIFMTLEKCSNWKDFVVSRFSRLYPAYWFAVSFTSILIVMHIGNPSTFPVGEPADNSVSFYKYIVNMSMFQYFFQVKDIDGPYWTLAIELIFYFFMLFLMVTKAIKHIDYLGAFILCLCLIYSQSFRHPEYQNILINLRLLFPLIVYFPLFFSGILIYKLKFGDVTLIRIFLLPICFIIQALLLKYSDRITGYSLSQYIFMLSLFFIVSILYLTNRLGFIVNNYTVSLGEISYSLYLIHEFICCRIILPYLLNNNINFWIGSLISLIFVISLSIGMNKYIEKPSMIFIRNKYKKWNGTLGTGV